MSERRDRSTEKFVDSNQRSIMKISCLAFEYFSHGAKICLVKRLLSDVKRQLSHYPKGRPFKRS